MHFLWETLWCMPLLPERSRLHARGARNKDHAMRSRTIWKTSATAEPSNPVRAASDYDRNCAVYGQLYSAATTSATTLDDYLGDVVCKLLRTNVVCCVSHSMTNNWCLILVCCYYYGHDGSNSFWLAVARRGYVFT